MVGLIVFVCFHIRHAFDTKEIDVILSRPISRTNLVLAYWLGFSFVSLLLALPVIGIVGLLGILNGAGFAAWAVSLVLEALLVVALALFSALALRSAVASVLACMGFYVLSRMMAFFVITAQSGMFNETKFEVLKWALVGISTVVPRLDFFAQTQWLVYGLDSARDWQLFALQAAIYIPVLLVASVLDFKRKQF
jgi:ABC-type transport system involved in multi-copper enzyme maturation permease subunit